MVTSYEQSNKEVTTFFTWLNYLPIRMCVHREWTTLLFQHW